MSMLLNQIQGDIRSHLLLNTDMKNPDYSKATGLVEDYTTTSTSTTSSQAESQQERTDSNESTEKGKTKERKIPIHKLQWWKERKHYTIRQQSKKKGKGKYGSQTYNVKGKGSYHNSGSYGSYNNTCGRPKPGKYGKEKKTKAKERQKGHTTTAIHNNHKRKE
eukprot:3532357-Amphidinium_carterae.1